METVIQPWESEQTQNKFEKINIWHCFERCSHENSMSNWSNDETRFKNLSQKRGFDSLPKKIVFTKKRFILLTKPWSFEKNIYAMRQQQYSATKRL